MMECRKVQEALAADDQATPSLQRHLESCAACAAFSRDMQRLQAAARALPRPLLVGRQARARNRWDRRLAPALAATAAILVVALVALAVWQPWQPRLKRGRPGEVAPTSNEPDVLALIERARRVWTPDAVADTGLAQFQSAIDDGWFSEIDPLASLRPAALLGAAAQREAASNPRRRP